MITDTSASAPARNEPVRGTQLLVIHMGSVFKRPSLTTIEIGWRWLVGIPILWVAWLQMQRILAVYPLEASGFNSIESQVPWTAMVQLAGVCSYYEPHVLAVLRWLGPLAALAWIVVSGVGRNLVLMRMEAKRTPRVPFRPLTAMLLQAAWLVLLALTFWCWFLSMRWAADGHLTEPGGPDLVGYFVWVIVLSLALFTAWALVSWALSVAPMLALLEGRSALSALRETMRLGKVFTSKLAEINLAMGVVKMAIIVLAMVLSAGPLPFSDELGSDTLHLVWAGAVVFYLVMNDFFQVVRLKAFVEFWRICRQEQSAGRSA